MKSSGIVPVYWKDIELVTFDKDGKAVWDAHLTINGIDFARTIHAPRFMNGDRLKLEILAWCCVTPDDGVDRGFWKSYSRQQLDWAKSPLCEELRAWVDEEIESMD